MTESHSLRTLTPAELGLVHGRDHVVILVASGAGAPGSSVRVHLPTLTRYLDQLGRHIDTVVFVHGPGPDRAAAETIDQMLAVLAEIRADALARPAAVTEAVKRVEDDIVVEGIDRGTLITVAPPELIRRDALERALSEVGDTSWAGPTALVTAHGASLAFHGDRVQPHSAGGRPQPDPVHPDRQ